MNFLNQDLASPFLFNALKHHHGYQINFIEKTKNTENNGAELKSQLIKVGRLMIDLYYGPLSTICIGEEIKQNLLLLNVYAEDSYKNFIGNIGKKFRIMELSDGSNWTLLIGREHDRYVHIHPSRGSKYTIRVGALAIKTAICLQIYFPDKLKTHNLVNLTNEVRKKYLHESPIKNEIYTRGIKRVLDLF